MSAYRITFEPTGKTVLAGPGTTVYQAMHTAGFLPDAPCGGCGKCGKCTVKVNLGEQVIEVLACRTPITQNMIVHLLRESVIEVMDRVGQETVGGSNYSEDDTCCAAIDIGTTTLAAFLVQKTNGRLIASTGTLNPQVSYGADVVARIRYAEKEDGAVLTSLIRNATQTLLTELCGRVQVDVDALETIAVVGNPCMQQIFLGYPVDNLISPPFPSVITKNQVISASQIWGVCGRAELRTMPSVFGYVGSDVTAGVLACGMAEREGYSLLVDIGTNGEMVLGNRARLICCATAAGPALEGANIKCGMRGAAGAIDHVQAEGGRLAIHTIQNAAPKGICGSGLVDLAAVLCTEHLINKRGRLPKPEDAGVYAPLLVEINGQRTILLSAEGADEPVFIDQEDIREIQLAKSAIRAGIEILMQEMGIGVEEIESVYLSGAFGSYMDAASACKIGLLPAPLLPKVKAIGNSAGQGAILAARDDRCFIRMEELVGKMEYVELSGQKDFQSIFARHMLFDV